jgi:hypothetical protein
VMMLAGGALTSPAEAGASTGTWRNGMQAGPAGVGCYDRACAARNYGRAPARGSRGDDGYRRSRGFRDDDGYRGTRGYRAYGGREEYGRDRGGRYQRREARCRLEWQRFRAGDTWLRSRVQVCR